MAINDLDSRFTFHPATTEVKRDAHAATRQACRTLADWIDALIPDGREKSLAISKVEEAMFWANAALARAGE